MGFLGNVAPDAADLNLLAQLSVLFLLLVGVLLAKISLFKVHGRFMIALIAFQFFAVFVWMLPSLLRNLGALGSGGTGTGITLFHVFAGSIAFAFVIAAAAHFTNVQLKWTMRLALSAWFLVIILGIAFYAHYYLGII